MQHLMTDRPIYKIRQRQYADTEFPLKVRPLEDELLSSWLVRMALEHKTLPATFTNLYLPETRNKLWAGDIDLHADDYLLKRLSDKAALSVETIRQMTFMTYEGVLFERLYTTSGGTPFLLKLIMRGRRSRSFGIRWCQQCLSEDERPFFRKKWRVSLFTACLKHRRWLVDRCACGMPLTLYKAKWCDRKPCCPKCGIDLADVSSNDQMEMSEDLVESQEQLKNIIDAGYVMMDGVPVYSHMYFAVLHQILKLMMSRRYGQRVREGVGMDLLDVSGYKIYETITMRDQGRILIKAVWLLNEWPQRFIGVCERRKLFSSALLKDFEQTPFWYWRIVMESLFNPDTVVTVEEMQEAARFMESH